MNLKLLIPVAASILLVACSTVPHSPMSGYEERLTDWRNQEKKTGLPSHLEELRHLARANAPEVLELQQQIDEQRALLTTLQPRRRSPELRLSVSDNTDDVPVNDQLGAPNEDQAEIRVGIRVFGKEDVSELSHEREAVEQRILSLQASLEDAAWRAEWSAVSAFRRAQAAVEQMEHLTTWGNAQQELVDRSLALVDLGQVSLRDNLREQQRLIARQVDHYAAETALHESRLALLELTGYGAFASDAFSGGLGEADSGFWIEEAALNRAEYHPALRAIHHQLISNEAAMMARVVAGRRPLVRYMQADVEEADRVPGNRWRLSAGIPLPLGSFSRFLLKGSSTRVVRQALSSVADIRFSQAAQARRLSVQHALRIRMQAGEAWERLSPSLEKIRSRGISRAAELKLTAGADPVRVAELTLIDAETRITRLEHLLQVHEAEIQLMVAIGPPVPDHSE